MRIIAAGVAPTLFLAVVALGLAVIAAAVWNIASRRWRGWHQWGNTWSVARTNWVLVVEYFDSDASPEWPYRWAVKRLGREVAVGRERALRRAMVTAERYAEWRARA